MRVNNLEIIGNIDKMCEKEQASRKRLCNIILMTNQPLPQFEPQITTTLDSYPTLTTSPHNPATRFKMGNASSAMLDTIVQGSNCISPYCPSLRKSR